MINSIKPTQISVHNPVFGPRNLGHYFGSMKDLVETQSQYRSIVVIDDVMAGFMSPRDRKAIPNRSYFVVQDFLNAGFDAEHNQIVLTSQVLPEIMDLIMFYSAGLEQDYLMHLYENSFMGGLKSYQRRGVDLGLRPSVFEVLYPALGMPAISLGLDVDFFQTQIPHPLGVGYIKFQFNSPLYVGATRDFKDGFVGCMSSLQYNGETLDLYDKVQNDKRFSYGLSTGQFVVCSVDEL